jgi:hypothetical protein
MKYHRIETVDGVTFTDLANSESERLKFKQALDKHGANGWSAVHFEQVGKRLLVFMVCDDGE